MNILRSPLLTLRLLSPPFHTRAKAVVLIICATMAMSTFASVKEVKSSGDAWISMNLAFEEVSPGYNFTITVNASHVDAMDAWQVFLKYNLTVMNVTGYWIPTDNVFSGFLQVPIAPFYGRDRLDGMGFAGFGSGLIVGNVSVTHGVLFKANCTALGEGYTDLLIATRNNPVRVSGPSAAIFSSLLLWDELYQSEREIAQPVYVQNGAFLVIPEFPSFLILPLFMVATLLAVTVSRGRARDRANF